MSSEWEEELAGLVEALERIQRLGRTIEARCYSKVLLEYVIPYFMSGSYVDVDYLHTLDVLLTKILYLEDGNLLVIGATTTIMKTLESFV